MASTPLRSCLVSTPRSTPGSSERSTPRVRFDEKNLKQIESEKRESPYGTMLIDDPPTPFIRWTEGRVQQVPFRNSPLSHSPLVSMNASPLALNSSTNQSPLKMSPATKRSPEQEQVFQEKRAGHYNEYRCLLEARKHKRDRLIKKLKSNSPNDKNSILKLNLLSRTITSMENSPQKREKILKLQESAQSLRSRSWDEGSPSSVSISAKRKKSRKDKKTPFNPLVSSSVQTPPTPDTPDSVIRSHSHIGGRNGHILDTPHH
ncbi:putative protein phosphatase inhibitor 2 [Blattamonas nauphoetae]|uniref:Uncharacterized protein n=1 Tax=Blattamonas nauphoetae TaxID=2049346 RepID=A0ABQ9YHQ2_9EUKA|nr:putative protein phosphatase inhibitor 2 [Blattamonas nauphoetae]